MGLKCWIKVDNSSSVCADNKKKDILVLGEYPTDRLDDATITAEVKYSSDVTRSKMKKKSALQSICVLIE